MNLNEIIAVNLKRLRAERGFSLGKLSELSGVSKVMLSQIEKGESRNNRKCGSGRKYRNCSNFQSRDRTAGTSDRILFAGKSDAL